MKRRNAEGSCSILNAENAKSAGRYARMTKKARARRDEVRRGRKEISEMDGYRIC